MCFWSQIDEKLMTEEESDVTIFYQHKSHWKCESNQIHYLVPGMIALFPFRIEQIYCET